MGTMTPFEALWFGMLLLLGWMFIGIGTLAIWRSDLLEDTWAALSNMLLWPLGVFMQTVWWPLYKRRRERARQARITVHVERGDYTAQFARETLNWKG